MQRLYRTSLWCRYIVAMETSDYVAKTASLQRLLVTSLYERLQRRRSFNVVRRSHRNYMAMSERRRLTISQGHCNNVSVSSGGNNWNVDVNEN